MWWSFRKSKKLDRWLRLNLGKRGAGVSLRRKRGGVSIGPRGRRWSFGIGPFRIANTW